jgi:hypothetical protein
VTKRMTTFELYVTGATTNKSAVEDGNSRRAVQRKLGTYRLATLLVRLPTWLRDVTIT